MYGFDALATVTFEPFTVTAPVNVAFWDVSRIRASADDESEFVLIVII